MRFSPAHPSSSQDVFAKMDGLHRNSGLPELRIFKRRKSGLPELRIFKRRKSGKPDLRCQARQ
jgi:hypothetical protein